MGLTGGDLAPMTATLAVSGLVIFVFGAVSGVLAGPAVRRLRARFPRLGRWAPATPGSTQAVPPLLSAAELLALLKLQQKQPEEFARLLERELGCELERERGTPPAGWRH